MLYLFLLIIFIFLLLDRMLYGLYHDGLGHFSYILINGQDVLLSHLKGI